MSRPVKRSFTIAGHRTSISLEAAFWDALKTLAAAERMPVVQLIARIDGSRGAGGLSGAVRVWILRQYQAGAAARTAGSLHESVPSTPNLSPKVAG